MTSEQIIQMPCSSIAEYYNQHNNYDEIDQQLQDQVPYGYINKTICGCGLTTYAIERENQPVIIAVPNISIIKSKEAQYPNPNRYPHKILGIYKGITTDTINQYIQECNNKNIPFKILTTYDSFMRLEYIINHYEPHIIIDESHQLFGLSELKTSDTERSIYQDDIITKMLNYLGDNTNLQKITFLSATPIPIRFFQNNHKWITHLPQIKIQWQGYTPLIPILHKTNHPQKDLNQYIIKPLTQENTVEVNHIKFTKAIIYINSITDIINIINQNKLNPQDLDFIISEEAEKRIKEKCRITIQPYNPYNLKKITFITSAGFCGLDIYDPEPLNIVISNGSFIKENQHLMIDINTQLIQCISRQRTPSHNHFLFIYNTWIGEKTEEDLKQEIETNIKNRITEVCQHLNQLSLTLQNQFISLLKESKTFRLYAQTHQTEGKPAQWQLNQFMYDVERYKIARIIMAYKENSTIFSDIIEKGEYLGKPLTSTLLPLKYKFNNNKQLLEHCSQLTSLECTSIDPNQIATPLQPLLKAIINYKNQTNNQPIRRHAIEHPAKFIEKYTHNP